MQWLTTRQAPPLTFRSPGRIYGYARVITVAQADEGESLDVQQRTIAGYAQMHGPTVERGIRRARRVSAARGPDTGRIRSSAVCCSGTGTSSPASPTR